MSESFTIKPATRAGVKPLIEGKFGRLTILREFTKDAAWRKKVKCRCDCGTEKFIRVDHIKSGRIASCGCLQSELSSSRKLIHGCCSRRNGKSAEWKVWSSMRQRCQDKRNPVYHRYGGRGITVCDRWQKSFAAFLADMGTRPTPKHTIERKNNNDGYNPDNCEWATRTAQANNRRSNHLFTLNGVTLSAAEWGRKTGIGAGTILARSYRGWADTRTLTTPINSCHSQ